MSLKDSSVLATEGSNLSKSCSMEWLQKYKWESTKWVLMETLGLFAKSDFFMLRDLWSLISSND